MKKFLLILACALALGAKAAEAQTARLGDAIRNAAEELSAGMAPDTRIAVISMRADSARMSNHLIDEMIMAFVNTQRVLVVNRAQLDLIAAEMHLAIDGLIDDATAQSIGRLAGVQFIYTGAFEPFGNIYRLRIQAIEVETAIIRRIHTANVWNDAVVSTLLGTAGRDPSRRGPRETRAPREPRDPDNPRVNWLSAEVSYTLNTPSEVWPGLGFGLHYERDLNELFSIGALLLYNVPFEFGALVTARFFLPGSPFYLEAGVGAGFNQHWWDWVGAMLSLGAGARLGGRTGGFFANPFVSVFPLAPESASFRFSRVGVRAGWVW
ncbi:MAG: hypothetical protein FWB79_01045 [Treponema sp.]|nr:hypothetical protein [Treponema sp.]